MGIPKPTMADVKKAAKKIRVHFHPGPRCSKGKHDKSCGSRPELNCAQVTVAFVKVCTCTHA